ncbi:MAG: type IX secretion system membrane protein PorP/SprF [bacterium]|nr:type IX secretion system membrane protein PorP/SprF [bacterium]
MKNLLFLTVFILLFNVSLKSQYFNETDFPVKNVALYSPALTGHGRDMLGFNFSKKESEKSALIFFDKSFKNKKMGLGTLVSHKQIGPFSCSGAQISYAYFFGSKKIHYGFGLTAGVYVNSDNPAWYKPYDEIDPALENIDKTSTLGTLFDFGTVIWNDNFFIDVSFRTLVTQPSYHYVNTIGRENKPNFKIHFGGAYNFNLSKTVKLTPTLFAYNTVGSYKQYLVNIGTNATFSLKNKLKFLIGTNYTFNKSLSIITGIPLKKMQLLFSYQHSLSQYYQYSKFEIGFIYFIGKENKINNPSNFLLTPK